MMKKGQGLPITIIIIAALGILVLIVIAAIFGGQMGKFGRITGECPGTCVVSSVNTAVPLDYINLFKEGTKCSDFETELRGNYIAKGTPKAKDLKIYKCDFCCITVG